MVFQWIKQEGFRYLIFNIHNSNHKDKSNMRKNRRMINYAYLDIHNCLSLNQNNSFFNSESGGSRKIFFMKFNGEIS